jgi:hypothetical protein
MAKGNARMRGEYGCNLCRFGREDFPRGKRVWELRERSDLSIRSGRLGLRRIFEKRKG